MFRYRYHALVSMALLSAGQTAAFQTPKPNTNKPKGSLDVSYVERSLEQPDNNVFAPAETFEDLLEDHGGMACKTDLKKRLQQGVGFQGVAEEQSTANGSAQENAEKQIMSINEIDTELFSRAKEEISSTISASSSRPLEEIDAPTKNAGKQSMRQSETALFSSTADTMGQERSASTELSEDLSKISNALSPWGRLAQDLVAEASEALLYQGENLKKRLQEGNAVRSSSTQPSAESTKMSASSEVALDSSKDSRVGEESSSALALDSSTVSNVRENQSPAVAQTQSGTTEVAALDLSKISNVLTPTEAFEALVQKGEFNAASSTTKILFSSALGGCYVGMGAMVSLAVAGNSPDLAAADPGLQKFIFAALFPMNLLLAQQCGGSLYTGNTANMMAALCEKRVNLGDMGRVLSLSWLGNLLGCGLFAVACKYAGVMEGGAGVLAASTLMTKTSAELGPIFVKAMFCNWLVCLAVLLSTQAKDMGGKYISIWLPISTFVSIGFEHSVANMFLLPAGLMSQHDITLPTALTHNLIPVTIGNAFSGALLVGATMSYLYGSLGKEEKN